MRPSPTAVRCTRQIASKRSRIHRARSSITPIQRGDKVLNTDLTQARSKSWRVLFRRHGPKCGLYNGQPVGGKTGTSEDYRDKWFCGITPQISVAIWIGDRNEKSMPTWVACDSIFGDFVNKLLRGQDKEEFPKGCRYDQVHQDRYRSWIGHGWRNCFCRR